MRGTSHRCTSRRQRGTQIGPFHAPFAARVTNGAILVMYLKGAPCVLGGGGRYGRPRGTGREEEKSTRKPDAEYPKAFFKRPATRPNSLFHGGWVQHPPSKTGQEPDFWFVRTVNSCAPKQ